MEGRPYPRRRGNPFALVLAISVLTFAGRASAQQPTLNLPPSGMPPRSYAGLVDAVSPQPLAAAQPACGPDGCASTTSPVTMGCLETMRESLCGENTWRPLTLGTFFSE